MAIYLTGDTHGNFSRIEKFCTKMETSKDDIIIVLGDAGINFNGGWIDLQNKKYISSLPITLFCIHGNHEQRPTNFPSYHDQVTSWRGCFYGSLKKDLFSAQL